MRVSQLKMTLACQVADKCYFIVMNQFFIRKPFFTNGIAVINFIKTQNYFLPTTKTSY